MLVAAGRQPARLGTEGETSRASEMPRVGPRVRELGVMQTSKQYKQSPRSRTHPEVCVAGAAVGREELGGHLGCGPPRRRRAGASGKTVRLSPSPVAPFNRRWFPGDF